MSKHVANTPNLESVEACSSLSREEIGRLKAELPSDAFNPAPSKLLPLCFHTAVIVTCFYFAGRIGGVGTLIVCGLIAGHSLAVVGFLSHELTHGIIVRRKSLLFWLERIFWSLALVSPTMWRRAHNQTHHAYLNTPRDCDRKFLVTQETFLRRWYVRLTYPNAEVFPWNPLVWVYMNLYFLRNTLAAFVSSPKFLAIVPAMPAYRPGDTMRVALDLVAIATVQSLLWIIGGFSLGRFLLMLLISQFATSVVVMSYIFTNHFLKPVALDVDAMRGSTSVIVPSWVDRLHIHYSYHTEHHLFPTLNSDYYPQLSKLLLERYPDRYHRIPIGEAWRQLWRQPRFIRDPRNETK